MKKIDVGDVVFHKPSGEELLVGEVMNGQLYFLGWPPARAYEKDCLIVHKATREERKQVLTEIAQSMYPMLENAKALLGKEVYNLPYYQAPLKKGKRDE